MRTIFKCMMAIMAGWMSVSQLSAQGWPANYNGVMLQGFYWDSYDDTRWALLEKQADELAATFSLIWIPQSANCGGTSMGYDDLYWFPGHYDSSFGSEAELRSMISTFKAKGLGTIADVVINHRRNISNWVDFPKETYQGVTYELKSTDIVSDDDKGAAKTWAEANGYQLSSNKDSGEGWDGMRDLDHQSENVQNNVKAYLKMLLEDMGYVGFRYDMVKGYSASYTNLYNTYSKPQFSVGECWDSSNTIKNWIDGTKTDDTPTSAAFDFQFKYTVRNAVDRNDWSYLGKQNDNSYPLVSSSFNSGNYRQYAVTFVENHDTEVRPDGSSNGPLKKDTLAANAYLLAMPGTPCVFLKHWQAYKQEIKAMVEARKLAGINNTSSYTNMRSSQTYYANLIKANNENRLMVIVGSNTNGYDPGDRWQEILSGHHYKYYLAKSIETAWADKASGSYKEPFSVKLIAVSEDSNAKLVYTLDGSEPTAGSTSVANGSTVSFSEEGDYTLKVGLLTNGTVKAVVTRSYTLREEKPEVFTIPSFCTVSSDEVCAFFEAPSTWSGTIACWAWSNSPSENFTYSQRQNWPGVDCVKIGTTDSGYSVWKWTWDGTKQNNSSATKPAYIIFSNGGSPQTNDMSFTNGGYYTKDGLKAVVSTGIREITADRNGKPSAIFSINGMRLPAGSSIETLPKGVYIINGRKVVR